MAKADFKMPADFLDKISKLGDQTDTILPRVLAASGEIVVEAVRNNLNAAIGGGKGESKSTGELAAALGVSPARIDRDGNFNVKIGFNEPRSDGGNNAKIANILEYGSHNQPARPFLKPARNASKNAAIEAMKRKLDEEISAL